MRVIMARCGYRCDLCLAYKEHVKSDKDRQRFKDGLLKYYNYRIKLKNCYCDGCLSEENKGAELLDKNCKVRACVVKRGLDNCAYCEEYPCKILKSKFVEYEKVAEKCKTPIPEEGYTHFIKPYENRKVFEKIRKEIGLN